MREHAQPAVVEVLAGAVVGQGDQRLVRRRIHVAVVVRRHRRVAAAGEEVVGPVADAELAAQARQQLVGLLGVLEAALRQVGQVVVEVPVRVRRARGCSAARPAAAGTGKTCESCSRRSAAGEPVGTTGTVGSVGRSHPRASDGAYVPVPYGTVTAHWLPAGTQSLKPVRVWFSSNRAWTYASTPSVELVVHVGEQRVPGQRHLQRTRRCCSWSASAHRSARSTRRTWHRDKARPGSPVTADRRRGPARGRTALLRSVVGARLK